MSKPVGMRGRGRDGQPLPGPQCLGEPSTEKGLSGGHGSRV